MNGKFTDELSEDELDNVTGGAGRYAGIERTYVCSSCRDVFNCYPEYDHTGKAVIRCPKCNTVVDTRYKITF